MTEKSFQDWFSAAGGVVISGWTQEAVDEDRAAREMVVPPDAAPLIAELKAMVENDPNRGTEHEGAFLDNKTRPRAREIGKALYAMGDHVLMIRAHQEVQRIGGFSFRSLEMAWDGIGDWLG
jgi:hypothetical protein